jgi:glycosyltransferase involved in cell wall biosynthesis
MRIAIDYTAAVNQQAGIGRFVRCLVNAVTVVDEQDSYVLVHAEPNPGAKPVYPRTGNVAIRRLPLNERALTILWHRLGVTLPVDWFTGPIDLFHSPDFVLPPQRRGKRVLTVHDLAFLLFPECADAGLRQYLEHVVPRSARRADFVLADSENTRNDVICLLGVPEQRVAVVPGGVEQRFRPQTDQQRLKELRDRLGLEDVPYPVAGRGRATQERAASDGGVRLVAAARFFPASSAAGRTERLAVRRSLPVRGARPVSGPHSVHRLRGG